LHLLKNDLVHNRDLFAHVSLPLVANLQQSYQVLAGKRPTQTASCERYLP
jgi:hypothetical protein